MERGDRAGLTAIDRRIMAFSTPFFAVSTTLAL